MPQNRKKKTRLKDTDSSLRHGLTIGLWAFILAVPLGLASQTVLESLPGLAVSATLLLIVIIIGVVFDVIGVAVTAARESPLHARASRGIFGAHRAAMLVRHAHKVASFCNDVVGDVTGTLSGAIGIAIVYGIFGKASPAILVSATTVMSAVVAGLIVGGKAYGKIIALRKSTEIVHNVARIMEYASRGVSWLSPRERS